jgi:hypothetical protein
MINNRLWKLRILWYEDDGDLGLRKLVERVTGMARKLQLVGSTIFNIDPMHMGLPFAGICVVV